MRSVIFVAGLLSVTGARADEITGFDRNRNLVVIGYRNRGVLWNVGAGLCLYIDEKNAGCGRILKISDKKMVVRLTGTSIRRLAPGDWVELSATNRLPAAIEAKIPQTGHGIVDLGVGFSAGFDYFFPNFKVAVALGRKISLGLEPLYLSFSQSATSSLTAYGGFLTFNYFLTRQTFSGFYATGGLGYYSIKLVQGATSLTPSATAFEGLIQWRGRGEWSLGLDVTLGAGAQYISLSDTSVQTSFQGLLPLFALTLGTSF